MILREVTGEIAPVCSNVALPRLPLPLHGAKTCTHWNWRIFCSLTMDIWINHDHDHHDHHTIIIFIIIIWVGLNLFIHVYANGPLHLGSRYGKRSSDKIFKRQKNTESRTCFSQIWPLGSIPTTFWFDLGLLRIFVNPIRYILIRFTEALSVRKINQTHSSKACRLRYLGSQP